MNVTTALENFKNVQNIFSMMSILQLTDHWWPTPADVQDGATYDFIIVGGGTAGRVIASRLAELRSVKILLVEAGGNPTIVTRYPAYFAHVLQTVVDWNVTSTKDKTMRYHKEGVAHIAQGKMLGGSSGLHYMAYARGNPVDYDYWAKITNDASWKFENILPLFIQSEKVIDKGILNSPADVALHGTQGKLKLIKYYHKALNKYLCAFNEIGTKSVLDLNDRNPLGVTDVLFTNSKTQRQNTAYSFLRLEKNNSYLNVLTNALVTKILFDKNKNAIGVNINMQNNKMITVKANKEVILSAGVFKTPQLLMVSGIGPRKQLINKNIKVISDLPVGTNFQDHPLCVSFFKMGKKTPATGPPNPHVIDFQALYAYFAVNKSQNRPDSEMIGLVINDPEIFLIVCGVLFRFNDEIFNTIFEGIEDKQMFAVFNALAYPKSRGEVLLNSKNMKHQPTIKLGYYTDDEDLINHTKSVIYVNGLLNTTYFKSVKAKLIYPKIEKCNGLNKQSEAYWRCYCSAMVTPGYYYVGTCAMGTVVDSRLLVNAVKKLRVSDASVMPTNVASLTLATVIMIAQKTSDMIIKEHSLK